MAKKSSEAKRSGFDRPASEIRSALSTINKRIDDLQALNPTRMTQRFDPRFQAVEDRVKQSLADIFGEDSSESHRFGPMLDTAPIGVGNDTPRNEWVQGYKDGIAKAIEDLKSVKQLFEEKLEGSHETAPQPAPAALPEGRRVFIVHGHDGEAKHEVARFLERLNPEPVILHEQPNQGQTIIEKLERHAPEARFVIVLMTPDDFGYPADHPELGKSRARQNVVLEHGIFLGRLGRSNVVALVKGNVERPSDLDGVLYEPMDERGA